MNFLFFLDEVFQLEMSGLSLYEEIYSLLSKKEKKTILSEVELKDIFEEDTLAYKVFSKIPKGWEPLFSKQRRILINIFKKLEGTKFFPKEENLFKIYEICPPEKVQVCILGLDPYINKTNGVVQATGMSFSIPKEAPLTPSLRNIFKAADIKSKHGDLTSWAKQGVFLLNSILSVSPGKTKSHEKYGWQEFTTATMNEIFSHNPKCIFLLWGLEAKRLKNNLPENAVVEEWCHPAERTGAFAQCPHFVKINRILAKRNKPPINWNLPQDGKSYYRCNVIFNSKENITLESGGIFIYEKRKLIIKNVDEFLQNKIILKLFLCSFITFELVVIDGDKKETIKLLPFLKIKSEDYEDVTFDENLCNNYTEKQLFALCRKVEEKDFRAEMDWETLGSWPKLTQETIEPGDSLGTLNYGFNERI